MANQTVVIHKGDSPPKYYKEWWEKENGVKHGLYTEWATPDRIWFQGNYVDGTRDGKWENFSSGISGLYKNGIKEGEWKHLTNGILRRIEVYKKGLPHGTWKDYDINGKIRWESTFSNGSGEMVYFDGRSSGQEVVRFEIKNGKRHGTYRNHPTEERQLVVRANYHNGKLHGTRSYYQTRNTLAHEKELIALESWKNGIRHGVWKTWGNPYVGSNRANKPYKLLEEIEYKDGRPIGEWRVASSSFLVNEMMDTYPIKSDLIENTSIISHWWVGFMFDPLEPKKIITIPDHFPSRNLYIETREMAPTIDKPIDWAIRPSFRNLPTTTNKHSKFIVTDYPYREVSEVKDWQRHGDYELCNMTGQNCLYGSYYNGKRHGGFVLVYGQRTTLLPYKHGILHGILRSTYLGKPNSMIIPYKDGYRNGWASKTEAGTTKRMLWQQGKRVFANVRGGTRTYVDGFEHGIHSYATSSNPRGKIEFWYGSSLPF